MKPSTEDIDEDDEEVPGKQQTKAILHLIGANS